MKPRAKSFHFRGYNFDAKALKITFDYRIEFFKRALLDFTETVLLPKKSRAIPAETLKKFLEPLHLILGISYYKLYCPPKMVLPFKLSKDQAEFWNTVYRKGLGEFLYRNKLDPKKIAKFPFAKIKTAPIEMLSKNRALLGIGGGKDSIVAAELLRRFPTTSFLVETQKRDMVSESVAKKIGNPSLKIKRILDPKIFDAYEGGYNGHIPISAIFAFLGLFTAALYDYEYFVVGNEYSSNFGNARYKGETVNHQWSKSAEFEAMFQNYARKFITPDILYFSLLRPFHEIRIAEMFSSCRRYFSVFSSCNRNFTVSKERPNSLWCGQCPKCAFVYLVLAPFVGKKKLIKIFGKNLLADDNLLPLYKDILGFGKMKPFDCVGTFDEARAALFLAAKNYKNEIAAKTFLPKIKHPQKLIEAVFKTNPAPTLPARFKFLGIKNVAILGYGKEGKITEKYIRKAFPRLKVGILDQNLDKNYLEKQKEYDLAVKTPGMQIRKVKIPYTTATNIFFSQIKNMTIGVTGSKGKSTTASLIYEILKAAGKKVRLIGNIGEPMLKVLLGKIDPKEIFVIELSSYMLEDIEYSPRVAVMANLFPDHMNYHGSIEKYYSAKLNIFKFQKPGDLAAGPPFAETIPLNKFDIPLQGEHNLKNIKAAIRVARLLKISDSAIRKAIRNFKPLPHRLEFVGEKNGIKFFDDANATTPEATIAAIETLKNIGTIFLGGEDRGYDFRELEKTLRKYKVKNIVLFPDSGKRILKSRKGFNILETRNMQKAVGFAYKNAVKGKICLLSTASPSYSLWKNFEEKGDEFREIVKKL